MIRLHDASTISISPARSSAMAVWFYCRFSLSYCDVSGLLECGIDVTYEAIRQW
jgi:transposase-like protein